MPDPSLPADPSVPFSGTRLAASPAPKTTPVPAMYDYEQAATRANCSSRHLRRLVDAGRAPAPVRLGTLCRFNVQVFEGWIAQGCPDLRKTVTR